jgi:acyl-CoA thioester hydrolase
LTGYPVVTEVAVRWVDMDALAHVNHAMYLRYFEAARIVYFERMGMGKPGPAWHEYGFVIASVTCRYRAPVTYPDTLEVGVRVAAWGRDRVLMEYQAFSRALDRVAAEAETLLVAYDFRTGRPMSIRQEQREAIVALEGHEPAPVPRRRAGGAARP